jgi:DNA-binding transcriptional LysR family regulator
MALPVGLDIDLLRTFVAIAEEGSFTRAAERVGRTQSAVSLQMQRLEQVLGQTLLDRGKGGSVELSQRGQYLLVRAREILAMNDDIVSSLRSAPLHGTVRLGFAEEFSSRYLSRILARFAEKAPHVEVEFTSTVSCALANKLKAGEFDLAVLEQGLEPRNWPAEEIWRERLCWVTSDTHNQHMREVLPVTVSPSDCQWRPPWLTECLWRGMALRSLEQSGRKHRIASTSGTTSGQLALALGGLAVVATLKSLDLPEGLRHVRGEEGLPELPEVALLMLKAREPRQPATDLLADCIRKVVSADAFQTGTPAGD